MSGDRLTAADRESIKGAIAAGYYDHTADEKVCAVVEEVLAERLSTMESALDSMQHFADVAERCEAKSNEYAAENERLREQIVQLERRVVLWRDDDYKASTELLELREELKSLKKDYLALDTQRARVADELAGAKSEIEVRSEGYAVARTEELAETVRALRAERDAALAEVERIGGGLPTAGTCDHEWVPAVRLEPTHGHIVRSGREACSKCGVYLEDGR